MNYEKDFPMKETNFIYFDNAATSLKPKSVIDKEMEYLSFYSANSKRGDYDISFKVDDEIENTRELVKDYINAQDSNEIIFTNNSTMSLNMIVFGYFKYHLKRGDEVLLNKAEHSSNILPWLMLKKEIGIKIKYIPINEMGSISLNNIRSVFTKNTKVISIASSTNVVGDKRNIKEISEYAHLNGAFIVVDASQSIGHYKTDVVNDNIDFLAFSAHKMLGPTGVGILYGKKSLLNEMMPIIFGGGMNLNYTENKIELEKIPYRFEAGTQNISGIIAFSESIKYINRIGLNNIERKEYYLRKYLIKELSKINYINILNKDVDSSTVLINIDGITSGDLGLYLNSKKICVRSGKHCAKMLSDETKIDDTVRISLYFYNTYEEIDKLIEALSDYEEIINFIKN